MGGTMSKVVEATGHAQASSVRRTNPARARELRDEVAKVIEQSHRDGADPEMVQARISTVRRAVGFKYDQAERKELAERTERENRIRENIRKRHPDKSPAEREAMAQREFAR
jgi:hypothetical protein